MAPTMPANSLYHLTSSSVGPEMISGVRASSMRMESTSSTIAKSWPRWTQLGEVDGHVVAQVVEAELVVGAVGDVGAVGVAALVRRHARQDHADAQAEEVVDAAHPLRVALGEVVVDGDDVDAVAVERVEVARQGGDERLALTGLHLGDVAEVQRDAAHDLDVEVALAEHALGGLPDRGERLGHQVVERLSRLEPLAELLRHAPQFLVAHRGELVLERVHLLGDRLELA